MIKNSSLAPLPSAPSLTELQARLKRLERRDWWMWGAALTIMVLLTVAVISFSFPGLWKENLFVYDELRIAVRALLGMVLLFSASTVYQQVLIHRLRARLTREVTSNLALQSRAEVLEKLTILDPLTGLYNRRFATQHLPIEIARAQRQKYPLTILMLDLNSFKQINDVYGHAAGDLVLQEFAHRLRKAFRGSDLLVRLGGDEFLVLLPECTVASIPSALARLADLRATYGGQRISFGAAAGWAEYHKGETLESLLERADQDLYRNKKDSRPRAPAREADSPPALETVPPRG